VYRNLVTVCKFFADHVKKLLKMTNLNWDKYMILLLNLGLELEKI